jgi:HD-GYP domain-containing protein (c-di-GMP phosphodiesterase class II)
MSLDAVVEELVRNSGTQFDPEVVRAVVACVERGELRVFARTEAVPLGVSV